jgi:hypothetical protein
LIKVQNFDNGSIFEWSLKKFYDKLDEIKDKMDSFNDGIDTAGDDQDLFNESSEPL